MAAASRTSSKPSRDGTSRVPASVAGLGDAASAATWRGEGGKAAPDTAWIKAESAAGESGLPSITAKPSGRKDTRSDSNIATSAS